MKYAKIRKYDTSNWDGINTTVFFSGCTFKCPGCFNNDAQDFNYGRIYDMNTTNFILDLVKDDHVDGLCILGGEPFQQDLDMLYDLVVKVNYQTRKPIHIWSGYNWEELMDDPKKAMILKMCDTLVDGRFELDKKDISLKYRGSSNQRVIDLKRSFKRGEVVEIDQV